ncbi:MAG: McrC family protein [Candidatus Hodarchaeales archaeon]
MSNPIVFQEYKSKSRKELAKLGLCNQDIRKLEYLNRKQRKEILKIFSDRIKATSNVGIISVGQNTIQILPKLTRDENESQIIKNLLFMLSYTNKIKIKETEISRLTERKSSQIFEILIYLYAKNLLETLGKNYYRDYQLCEDNLFYVKGRISFQENIKQNHVNKHRVYCHYSEFTDNVLLNQIFRYTTLLLTQITVNQENYVMLKKISFILSDVELIQIKPEDFQKIRLNRLNQCYEPLLQLAKIFITEGSIELFNNNLETYTFVFQMEQLFEEFIAEFIRRNRRKLGLVGVDIRVQDRSKKLVDAPRRLFTLRPDILLMKDGRKLIIDTKYKELNYEDRRDGVSPADMYQMLAYGVKHECNDCVLLYPAHLGYSTRTEMHTINVREEDIRVHIKSVPIDINMMEEQDVLIKSLGFIKNLID